MRRIAIALFTCIMILLSTAMVASPQSIAYGHTWGGKEYDFESAIAVDSVGNVYIAGYSVAAGTWITSGFLAKFDPNGNLQWSKEISSQFSDSCIVTQLAVAESGDVYVTGQTSQSGSTAFVAKFTSDGTLLYSRGLSNLSYPESLAVDPTTGGFVIAATSTSNWMGVVAAFNADGSWKWMRYEPTYQAYPYGVAVNADGNTYAFCDISTYGTVVGLTKFDATGNVLAQKRLNTAAVGQAAWDVRFAPDGNLVALGTQFADQDALIAKMNKTLNPIWTETISSPMIGLDGSRLGVSFDGSIYALCEAGDRANNSNLSAIFHLDSSGNLLSGNLYEQSVGSTILEISDIAVLPNGGIIMGGTSMGTPTGKDRIIDDALATPVNGSWISNNLSWTADRVWLEADPITAGDASMPVDDFSYDMKTQAWWGAIDLPAPQISVAVSATSVDNYTYSFTSAVSNGTEPYSYHWSFGDGTFSNSSAPTHTFDSAGAWWVQLVVTDSEGRQGYASVQIRIMGPPVIIDFQASPQNATAYSSVYFYVIAVDPDGGTIVQYQWDYGDNSTPVFTSDPWVEHIYQWAGDFQATVWVTDSEGQVGSQSIIVNVLSHYNDPPYANFQHWPYNPGPGTDVVFDGSPSWDPDGWVVSYAWSFGDNGTGYGQRVNHTYQALGTYQVILTVTDNEGASSSQSQIVWVTENIGPVANLAWSPLIPTPGQWVMFSASGSYDPDGWIQTYYWDFGDGTQEYSYWNGTIQHSYSAGGFYNVSLTVQDDRGAATTVTSMLHVDLPPMAVLTAPENGKVGTPMEFSGKGSHDPDGSIARYYWEFGDGGWAQGMEVSHAYATPGAYTVTLTVTDDTGANGSALASVSALTPKPPVAIVGYSPYPLLVGEVCTFNGSSSVDPDGSISTYVWQFGDGSVANGAMANHTYRYAGQYEVRLVVIDEDGLSASTTVTVNVVASKPKTSDPTGTTSTQLSGTPLLSLLDVIGIACVVAASLGAMTLFWWARKGRKGLT